MKLSKNFLNNFFLDVKSGYKHQWEVVTLCLIVLICCTTNFIKNFKCGGSHIDSADWIKSKKAILNPVNKNDNKYFQYAATVT